MGYRPVKPFLQRMAFLNLIGIAAIFTTGTLARRTHDPNLFLAVKVLTAAMLVLTIWVMWGWYRTRDERQRLHFMRVLALTGALTVLEAFAIPFVVPGHFRLTGQIVFFTLLGTFMFSAFALDIRRDLLERDPRYALWRVSLFTPPFIAPLMWWLLTLIFPLPAMTLRIGLMIFAGGWLVVMFYLAFSKASEK